MTTLELTSTDAIMDELKRRFPVMIFAGMSEWDRDSSLNNIACAGGMMEILGLLKVVDYSLTQRIVDDMRETDERL